MDKLISSDESAKITLRVNGKSISLWVEPSTMLAQVLRESLGLTGTKVACGMANCGACTVWIEKTPVYSCIALAVDCDGREITTIEGLADAGRLHPLQRAFVEEDAFQCGFCTSGQIMALAALLDRNPNPTDEEIKRAGSGNLCRCGSYQKIIKAVKRASEWMRSEQGSG
jgi:xanthine dehydrogenase YagT iron-sulfur-binding subunit